MNWLDGAIIALIIWLTYAAFQAGFIRESVTFVAAILGIVLAGIFYQDMAQDVLVFIDNETMANIAGFGLVFGAVVLAGQIIQMILKPTVHMLQLGIFDQLAGAAFGFAKAIVFVEIFVIVFITYPKWGMDKTIENSEFGKVAVQFVDQAPFIEKMLPKEFGDDVTHFIDTRL